MAVVEFIIELVLSAVGEAVAALLRSGRFLVVRRIRIAASPSEVFAHVARAKAWTEWLPWPVDGVEDGKARVNNDRDGIGGARIGKGLLSLVALDAPRRAVFALDLQTPARVRQEIRLVVARDRDGARVLMSVRGCDPYALRLAAPYSKAAQDRALGEDVETALTRLRASVEASK